IQASQRRRRGRRLAKARPGDHGTTPRHRPLRDGADPSGSSSRRTRSTAAPGTQGARPNRQREGQNRGRPRPRAPAAAPAGGLAQRFFFFLHFFLASAARCFFLCFLHFFFVVVGGRGTVPRVGLARIPATSAAESPPL